MHHLLEKHLRPVVAALLPDANPDHVTVRPCPDPKFGDYQCNALIGLAKQRKINPRQLATDVVARLDVSAWFHEVEIAGAGFLNFRVRPEALAQLLERAARGEHLFYEQAEHPRTVVVDFSSPNVAKPMHVGHIRSTFLGDCLARTLRLLGHRVITDNHIGDWGTQFGKLLVGWKDQLDRAALAQDPLTEMERLYKTVNAACEQDPATLERARQELVKLQNGDQENRAIWEEMIRLSLDNFNRIYSRVGVQFDQTLGESFYNPKLKGIVTELADRQIARQSEGAMAVFFEDIPSLKDHPALIQKSDGAANYTTTDLATIAYRLETWNPDEIVYVTDGRQQLHFNQLFAVFARWHPDAKVRLAHVWFGTILGEEGRPFKTRTGDTVRLADLLDEAEERALKVVTEKNPDLEESQRKEIARVIGLGAIKYADLLPNRQSDYTFSWDKMLALHGNTAPYLQYAYARTRSLLRKMESEGVRAVGSYRLVQAEEIDLAKHLLNFGLVLETLAAEYRPNYLCNYLYDLAGRFARFWEACPILKADPELRPARVGLSDLTGRVLKQGLDCLGIETLDQM